MPFNFDPGDLEGGYFEEFLPNVPKNLHQVNAATPDVPTTSDAVGGVGGETVVLKDLSKSIDIKRKCDFKVSPPTPLTAEELRFFELTGHVPGDAWEGELPNDHLPDVGKMVTDLFDDVQACRSIPWPEVMQGAAEERAWGRKSTLALMYPHHEGRFEWYEHPTTKKWHSYATLPN